MILTPPITGGVFYIISLYLCNMKVIIHESQFNRMINNSHRWGLIGINEGQGKIMTQDEFIEKAQKVHQNPDGTPKYTYDKVDYVNNKTPVIITCPKHGDFPRPQTPVSHLQGAGCPKCGIESRAKKKIEKAAAEFIEKAQKVHQNPDGTPKYTYDNVNYVNAKLPVYITCPIHGDFPQTPNVHLSGNGCRDCGNNTRKTKDEFIRDAQKVHQNPDGTPKYTYDEVDYVNNKTPVIITCPKHGDFPQTPDGHLQGNGCYDCGIESTRKKRSSTSDEFIEKAQKVHQNPDGTPKYTYDEVDYVNNKTPVIITCPKHGDWGTTTPDSHLKGTGCPKCRESKGEKTIRNYLEQEYGYEVVPQKKYKDCNNKDKNKKTCREYKFDFYLPQFNTLIEFDGEQHFKKNFFHKTDMGFLERVEDDLYKVNYCKNNNIKLIRISYNEKDIIGQLNKGLKSKKKLWLSDNYPKAGWNK